jgi:hypothetical protein
MSGTNGANDIVDLFSRVTALEQSDVNTDQTLAAIVKNYSYLGVEITITVNVHDYRLCGDPDLIYGDALLGILPTATLTPGDGLILGDNTNFFDNGLGYPLDSLYPSDTLLIVSNANYLKDGAICATDCYI